MAYRPNDNPNQMRQIINLAVLVMTMIVFAWFCSYSYGKSVVVSGQSMENTLYSEDIVWLNRVSYKISEPKRYDVIAFKTGTSGNSPVSIKRIIGLPGEAVQIKDNHVYIDGVRLEDEEGYSTVALAGIADEPLHLEEDEYFVLGDNSQASEDSRFASHGNVERAQIEGKVWIRTSPITKLKLIK